MSGKPIISLEEALEIFHRGFQESHTANSLAWDDVHQRAGVQALIEHVLVNVIAPLGIRMSDQQTTMRRSMERALAEIDTGNSPGQVGRARSILRAALKEGKNA